MRINEERFQDLILMAGTGCPPELAKKIAGHLKIDFGKVTLEKFSDGETYVEIGENVRGKSVYVLQSVGTPANDNLMELLLLADALRRASAASIIAVTPYLCYSRQDRRPRSLRVPISARLIADMLTTAGVARVLTLDLHAEQIQGFYNLPVENIFAQPVLMGDVASLIDPETAVIVAPDVGGVVRARAFASALGCQLAIIDKRRPRANETKVMHVIGEVKGRDCFLVDDIVDTANTLCQAADILKSEFGARGVRAYCTHPVLSGDAVSRIAASNLDELVVCDTLPLGQEARDCDRIRSLTVSQIIAETVSRIHQHESISSLF